MALCSNPVMKKPTCDKSQVGFFSQILKMEAAGIASAAREALVTDSTRVADRFNYSRFPFHVKHPSVSRAPFQGTPSNRP